MYEIDKTAYSKLKTNDRKRLIRALEIYRTTGKNPTQINNESKCDSKYNFIIFGLNASDRNFIYNQIDNRVDEMMKTGLEEEARYLYNTKLSNTACQAIGYKELFEYFDGKTSLDEAVSKLKQSSRNYAKRQITWFKKEKNVHWFDIDKKNYEEIMKNTIDGIVKCLNI